jgi:hypothetical protein
VCEAVGEGGDWNAETEFLPWSFAVSRFTALSHIRDRMRDRLVFDEDVVLAMEQETESAAAEFGVEFSKCPAGSFKIGYDVGV